MSRRSRHYQEHQDQNDVNEPWEQPIYDESEEEYTRSGKRNKKKSNTKFLTTVLILIFLIAAIPISAGAWVVFQKNKPAASKETVETSISSMVESSSTKTSKTSETTSESTVASSSEAETNESSQVDDYVAEHNQNNQNYNNQNYNNQNNQIEDNQNNQYQNNQNQNQTMDNGTGEYIEVLPGEGPASIAGRAGISVEELYRLTGTNAETFFVYPGQKIKIR